MVSSVESKWFDQVTIQVWYNLVGKLVSIKTVLELVDNIA